MNGKYKDYTNHNLTKGRLEIQFFLFCLENYRKEMYPKKTRASFLRDIINRDKIRISYRTYTLYKTNKHRKTDRQYLPNIYFLINILEPLNISLFDLYTNYAPKP
jgi:hypothetical protein